MTKTTRVTEKGQATIPKELREKYDLQPGDEVVWLDTEDGIVVTKRTHTSGRGLLVPDDTPAEKREEIAEAEHAATSAGLQSTATADARDGDFSDETVTTWRETAVEPIEDAVDSDDED